MGRRRRNRPAPKNEKKTKLIKRSIAANYHINFFVLIKGKKKVSETG